METQPTPEKNARETILDRDDDERCGRGAHRVDGFERAHEDEDEDDVVVANDASVESCTRGAVVFVVEIVREAVNTFEERRKLLARSRENHGERGCD